MTSRDDGFTTADVSVSILDDLKFRALWRALGDPGQQARAVTAYLATITASWAAGCRVPADDALPTWMDDPTAALAAMVQVGLLDADHRLPEHAWASWFTPAWERREAKRAGGRVGGQRSWQVRSEGQPKDSFSTPEGKPNPYRTVPTTSDPTTSVPTTSDPTGGTWDDFTDPAWGPFREAWTARGLDLPPTPAQRKALWPIVDARPEAVGTWVQGARIGAKASEIVGHVLTRRHVVQDSPSRR